ncbi:MAG: 2,3-bisphosphoglycerate-independent phosphoglycerate mutase [Planctomycetota bacterium JB042]
MRTAIVVLSGVADRPAARLKERTPLQVARTPGLDALARGGRVGAVRTSPDGSHAGSDVALLTLLGYDPRRFPLRRGPLEAAGAGIDVGPQDLALRGNLVTLHDERIADLTAGRISTEEAAALLHELAAEIHDDGVRLHPLHRYRFVMVIEGGRSLRLETAPPHAAFGKAVREVYPKGEDAARFERILDRSRKVLAEHEINRVRIDLGENPANFVWLWGEGAEEELPSFADRFGLRGSCVAGAALAKGIARRAGFDVVDVPGASGDLDSDLAAKGREAVARLESHDLVFVHVQGANEASHLRDPMRKVEVIQEADREVIRPLVAALEGAEGGWRLLVASDHVTATESDELAAGLAPFLIAGSEIDPIRGYPFDEEHAARSDLQIDEGASLMSFFLGRNPSA